MDINTLASHIRLVAFDIDGVMTDGGLTYTDEGHERKTFNVQDGLGIKLLQRAEIEVAIVTGRSSGGAKVTDSSATAAGNAAAPSTP